MFFRYLVSSSGGHHRDKAERRPAVRIATWNVNSLAVRLPRVLEWLTAARPDVLCLQETKLADSDFPHAALA